MINDKNKTEQLKFYRKCCGQYKDPIELCKHDQCVRLERFYPIFIPKSPEINDMDQSNGKAGFNIKVDSFHIRFHYNILGR